MSEEEDRARERERQRQESNARNRSSANHYKKIAEDYQAKADKKKKELQRLNDAKRTLEKEKSSFTTFEEKVKNYSGKLSKGSFKGTLRNKFDEKTDAMGTDLQSEKNKYESNLSKISTEIAKRELEQGDLLKSASNAWDSVRSFLASIF